MKRILLSLLPCLLAAQTVPAHIDAFQATARAVRRGGTVTLRWSATGVDQVRLDPLGLILPAKGEITHLVSGRTVYWLHVTNGAGGQSVPLVVDLVPEEPAPLPPVPSILSPLMPPERPRMAALPDVPAPAPGVALPPPDRAAHPQGARTVWIQFAATVSSRGASRLQRTLLRTAATESTLQVRHRRSGRPFQLVRSGPFPSVQAARQHLLGLSRAMKALGIRPMVILGPAQPLSPVPIYVADSHQP
ncbi:SPOR domain-containing protein [Mesoterricola silvestris]|uniref:SPOR domain-containing protein n=1 Tax=Mesoterricola silvestris TaxID=2927979 RepID=A0AA48K9Y0_9BACT|nr:SPOR domain-containing protein [Mesoterricola silvestris]BDU74449.1 hypothetical protein METEAL_36230 [Mesoterricola silvestris]